MSNSISVSESLEHLELKESCNDKRLKVRKTEFEKNGVEQRMTREAVAFLSFNFCFERYVFCAGWRPFSWQRIYGLCTAAIEGPVPVSTSAMQVIVELPGE